MVAIEQDSQGWIINAWQDGWTRIKVFDENTKKAVLCGTVDKENFRFCDKSKMWIQRAYG